MVSRRAFVRGSAAALAAAAFVSPQAARAAEPRGPLGRPIGIQLYTVREQAAADLPGTLNALAAMGYREVELAGLHDRTAAEFGRLLGDAGLKAVSAHYSMVDLQGDLAPRFDDLDVLGVQYLVCSFPGMPDPQRLADRPGGPGRAIFEGALTLDEWRWNAAQLDRIGAEAARAGLRFAYHNHSMEFRSYDDHKAFDVLLQATDPARVFLELDCAWVAVGGENPADFVRRCGDRVRLLHIKDLKPGSEVETTAVGHGTIDWPAVFAAADPARLDHYFVEQEHFSDGPPLEAAAQSIRYLRGLAA